MQSSVRVWACMGGCVAVLALACGGESAPPDDPCSAPDGGEPTLELGTGEVMFESVVDDQQVPLVAGSQGGYHVWLSMRARGVCPGRHEVALEVNPEGEGVDSKSNVQMSFEAVEGQPGWVEHVGWPARVFKPECAVDQPVQLSVTLHPEDEGEVLEAEVEVVPTAPEAGFPACEDAS